MNIESVLQTGIIQNVNIVKHDDGTQTTTVDIQTHLSYGIIQNVPLESPLFVQYVPVVGQQVVFVQMGVDEGGAFRTKIIGYYGSRPFDAPINPGEVIMEGEGGSFLYLDLGGNMVLSDQVMSNVIQLLNSTGIQITADAMSINVKGVGQISVTPKNVSTGTEESISIIKDDGSASPATKVTLTNGKIIISGGTVEIGPELNPIKGGVVTSLSGVEGAYSFDIMTGQPIPGSGTTKSTI